MSEHDKHDDNVVNEAVEASFASGTGVVVVSPQMTDTALLSLVKKACNWSKGKPFVIIPPYAGDVGGSVIPELLSTLPKQPSTAYSELAGHAVIMGGGKPVSALTPFLMLDGRFYQDLSKHQQGVVRSLLNTGSSIGISLRLECQGATEKELFGLTDEQLDDILGRSQTIVRVSLNPSSIK